MASRAPMRQAAAVLVSGPASGQGKTTVAAALARLHVRAGRRVRAFKCGPDFIDPGWLAAACGHEVDNLDLWMTGEDDARERLWQAAGEADLVLVEGAMGLFDGTPAPADLARRFGLPVLAVIDASAMAGTFGALAYGLQHFRPGLPWAGVLANRVAGEAHARMLQQALQAGTWLGALPRDPAFELPERHLGLALADELPDAPARLDAAADALARTPLGAMGGAALSAWRVDFEAPPARPAWPRLLEGRTIAVARDAAFCFIYPANLAALRALGAELVFFSPLRGEPPPPCDAVWLPGGYPELHGAALAGAAATREALHAHVAAGRPLWAECGGMMVLRERLRDPQGQAWPMWGLLPGEVHMQPRLAAIGPQSLPLAAGTLRGHSFHYSRCDSPLPARTHTRPAHGPGTGEPVWGRGALRASYFHAWFPSSPQATAALFTAGEPWAPE